jgi:hypothetical protein
MKGLFRIFLATVFTMSIVTSIAQITKALPEEFKEIKARPLIIEMLEVDNDFIEKQEKQIQRAKKQETKDDLKAEIENHKNFVAGYNKAINESVQKYWNLNKAIEYKTTSEVDKLRKAKNSEYTVLYFSESSTSVTNNGHTYRPGINLPTMNYSRIEKIMGKVDYSFFMPSIRLDGNEMAAADLVISLKIMKNHISEIEKTGEKNYTAKDFGKDQEKVNCSKLQGKPIFLDKKFLNDRTTEDEIISANKNNKIQVVSFDELNTAIMNSDDKFVAINIPYGIKAGSANVGVTINIARVQYMKSLVNANTGMIVYVNGVSTGELYDSYWRANQVGKIGDCK